jgi:integrase
MNLLVEIRGSSKRRKRPSILTVAQFRELASILPQPYRMMATVGICLGLRVNEVTGFEME